jgi:hypothetical protein
VRFARIVSELLEFLMKNAATAFIFFFAIAFASLATAGTEREFYRIYQPRIGSGGEVTARGEWREIPGAHADNPKTWVAPFSDSGSQLMPRCQVTRSAGLKVSSVLGNFNPRITIHVSEAHSLRKSISRTDVLQTMIECIQLNLRSGSFFTIRISTDEGLSSDKFVHYEGSYATLKS